MRRVTAPIVACWTAAQVVATPAHADGALEPVLGGLDWGESSDALKRHFGSRAVALAPPIEFGDSYVDVALRDVMLGGYRYVVYFQMDYSSHGLRRVMYERQRHGANHTVFDAAVRAIEAQGGKPASCTDRARPGNGYQAMREYVWRNAGRRVRAIYRDTTLAAESGCQEIGFLPCGLEGHLFIVIEPETAPEPDCG